MSSLSAAFRAREADARLWHDGAGAAAFQLAAERLEAAEHEIHLERDGSRRMAAEAAYQRQRSGMHAWAPEEWTRRADALDEVLCLLR